MLYPTNGFFARWGVFPQKGALSLTVKGPHAQKSSPPVTNLKSITRIPFMTRKSFQSSSVALEDGWGQVPLDVEICPQLSRAAPPIPSLPQKDDDVTRCSLMSLNAAPSLDPVDAVLLKKFYRQMLLIRRFEERAGQLYGMGQISGFCHLYIGQESIAVGCTAAMAPQDTLITAYRDHGHMLAVGMDPRSVMAELTGRRTGASKGKGGSMHMFSREKNFYGGHGIVGGQVPLGTGLAFAHQYRKDAGVCLIFLGDGAANQGQVYESFNMASLWKLPAVYIIENNGYAMGTSVGRACAGQELFRRGEAFGIPGRRVDGQDVLAVREATWEVLQRARQGEGPSLLEMDTYRYRGHSMSDPGKYRTKDEIEHVKENRDPLLLCEALLAEKGVEAEKDLKNLEKDVKEIVADAVSFAQTSPEPEPQELFTDILTESGAH